ncbi:MAG: IS3 family transposase [Planctomycetota bacterium]|nr:IS3 family transposase [Planctomycetota bacterium]
MTTDLGLIHHSDHASQYASASYSHALKDGAFVASMSRGACCYDNAGMDCFFHTLKAECVHRDTFHTHAQAKLAIFDYIETFYNQTRKHSTLGNISPETYENRHQKCA